MPGQHSAQFAAPLAIPAQVAGLAPAQVGGPEAEPRFSGQQQAKGDGGLRRGWRTRRNAPEPQQQAGGPSGALTGETGSFNGFTPHPDHPASSTPAQSGQPPVPAQRGRRSGKEDDYVGWVNDLGK